MNMPLEKQVCDLELAKRIKELGVEQESLWYWIKHKPDFYENNPWFKGKPKPEIKPFLGQRIVVPEYYYDSVYSAFTVAELGKILPKYYKTIKKEAMWSAYDKYDAGVLETISNTEANARAKMLIYLLENDLIKHNN